MKSVLDYNHHSLLYDPSKYILFILVDLADQTK